MPIQNYKISQGENGAGTPETFNVGENGDTYNAPPQPQVSTVTVTVGDAGTGWATLVTNTATGDSVNVVFDPVDVLGAASAATADAARTLRDEWNSNASALTFGRATLSGSVVTITFNDDRFTFTVVTTEAGGGAATDATATSASILNTEFGAFAFRLTDGALSAGGNPFSLATPNGADLTQLVGVVVKRLGIEAQPLTSTITYGVYNPGENVPVLTRGIIKMPCSVAVVVGDTLAYVDSAPSVGRVGWVTTGAGVTIPATTARIYEGGPAGGLCKVQFMAA